MTNMPAGSLGTDRTESTQHRMGTPWERGRVYLWRRLHLGKGRLHHGLRKTHRVPGRAPMDPCGCVALVRSEFIQDMWELRQTGDGLSCHRERGDARITPRLCRSLRRGTFGDHVCGGRGVGRDEFSA